MKKFMLLGLMSLICGAATAQSLYAPTLDSVVVLFDVGDREYSPFLFHNILGEQLSMKMDEATCAHVRISSTNDVICQGASQETVVGSVGESTAQDGFWQARKVQWSSNVEIVSAQTKAGTVYSLKVK